VLGAIRALLGQGLVTKANKVLLGVYQKGWAANQMGQHRSANPYPGATPYWDEWNRGWLEFSRVMKRRQSDVYRAGPTEEKRAQPK
jgi:hypothetical protein